MAQRCPGYLIGPMAAMFGVIAAVAELPRSFRHIDSTDAKSTFRTLASTMPMHVSIEWEGVMPGSNEAPNPRGEPRSTRITTSSCTFYKLDKCLTAEEPEGFLRVGVPYFSFLRVGVPYFGARILHV